MIVVFALLVVLAERTSATLTCGQFSDVDIELQPEAIGCDEGVIATGECVSAHSDECLTQLYYTNGSLVDTEPDGSTTCDDEGCDVVDATACFCTDVILCVRNLDGDEDQPKTFRCYGEDDDEDDDDENVATDNTLIFIFVTFGTLFALLALCYCFASSSFSRRR